MSLRDVAFVVYVLFALLVRVALVSSFVASSLSVNVILLAFFLRFVRIGCIFVYIYRELYACVSVIGAFSYLYVYAYL